MGKQTYSLSAVIMGLFFLLGVTLGCAAAVRAGVQQDIIQYLNELVSDVKDSEAVYGNLGRAVFNNTIYAAVIFVFGFNLLGLLVIPSVMLVKGFLTSFAITMFLQTFGTAGLLWAAGGIGAQTLFTVPCLLILASNGVSGSLAKIGNGRRMLVYGGARFAMFGICMAVLILSALFEAYLTPKVLSLIAA